LIVGGCAVWLGVPPRTVALIAKAKFFARCGAVRIGRRVVDEILSLSQGDMRRAVTMLQSAHSLSGGRRGGDKIHKDSIAEMVGLPPPALIDGLISVLRGKKFDKVREYIQDIVLEGYSAEYVLSALMAKIICLDNGISDQAKAIIAIKVAEADKNLIDGSDEMLQLLAVCSIALEQFKKKI
jgi:replication factor C subunit 2/4